MTSRGNGRAFAFLVNPSSGGGAAPGAVVPVARLLREAGAVVDVTYSPGPQAMTRLVDEAVTRGDVVVSVGGDGMLSSLAGLVAGRDATLAMVPAGRGNDFARMLGLPDDPAALARVLLEGEVRRVDLLAVSGLGSRRRMVAGSVYAGVDARAAAIADRATWLPRSMQYPTPPCAPSRPTGPATTGSRSTGSGTSTPRPRSWSRTPPTTARACRSPRPPRSRTACST